MTPQDAVIRVTNLRKCFGAIEALREVSLEVERGQVFGLVGRNGAGKTTLIKHVLGMMKPSAGQVTVFGLDPREDRKRVLARVGYLSEDRDLPLWMRIRELFRYLKAFYPSWDSSYALGLCERFGLDPTRVLAQCSQGQLAQAALIAALAHRPELLLLDEPSSGLDPVVRSDILEAIVHEVAAEGRTVLFSTHLLGEVERTCHRVAIINEGRVVLNASIDEIQCRYKLTLASFDTLPQQLPELTGAVLGVRKTTQSWRILHDGTDDRFKASLTGMGARTVAEYAPELEDVFFFLAGRDASHQPGER